MRHFTNGGSATGLAATIAMSDALVREFSDRWQALGGHIFSTAGPMDMESVLARAALEAITSTECEGSSRTVVYEAGVIDVKWETVVRGLEDTHWVSWDDGGHMRTVAAEAVAGITGCAWAVASTGSVVLYHSGPQGLLPSVLPQAHIVVVRRDQIVATVPDGFKKIPRPIPRMMKIISGPSMTADIEATLVVGVHGPRWVGAVIL